MYSFPLVFRFAIEFCMWKNDGTSLQQGSFSSDEQQYTGVRMLLLIQFMIYSVTHGRLGVLQCGTCWGVVEVGTVLCACMDTRVLYI